MRRTLRPRAAGDDLLDLASNDYLGLARDPRVTARPQPRPRHGGAPGRPARGWSPAPPTCTPTSRPRWRLRRGTRPAWCSPRATSRTSARWPRSPAGQPGGLGRAEPRVAGGRLPAVAGAGRRHTAPRRGRRRQALATRDDERAVVVTDAVFSVDGDLAPLAALHAVARRHGALLVVDEAHGLGVVGPGGRGALRAAGLAGEPDVVLTLTLSKSLGSRAAPCSATPSLSSTWSNTARPFIFDTGLAPAAAAAAARRARGAARRARARDRGTGHAAARWPPARATHRAPVTTPQGGGRVGAGRRPGAGAEAAARLRDARRPGRLLPAAVGARRGVPAAVHRARRPDRRRPATAPRSRRASASRRRPDHAVACRRRSAAQQGADGAQRDRQRRQVEAVRRHDLARGLPRPARRPRRSAAPTRRSAPPARRRRRRREHVRG